MASRNFDATQTPVAIETALSLGTGDEIYFQNVDPKATLYVRSAAVQPDATMRAHKIEAGGSIYVKARGDGSPTWAWTDDPDGCACIATSSR